MTTFTTTINSMYTIDTPEPGFVCNVLWTVTGVDGTYTAEIGGNSQFTVVMLVLKDQRHPNVP